MLGRFLCFGREKEQNKSIMIYLSCCTFKEIVFFQELIGGVGGTKTCVWV